MRTLIGLCDATSHTKGIYKTKLANVRACDTLRTVYNALDLRGRRRRSCMPIGGADLDVAELWQSAHLLVTAHAPHYARDHTLHSCEIQQVKQKEHTEPNKRKHEHATNSVQWMTPSISVDPVVAPVCRSVARILMLKTCDRVRICCLLQTLLIVRSNTHEPSLCLQAFHEGGRCT